MKHDPLTLKGFLKQEKNSFDGDKDERASIQKEKWNHFLIRPLDSLVIKWAAAVDLRFG